MAALASGWVFDTDDYEVDVPKDKILILFELHTNILKSPNSYEKFRDLYKYVHSGIRYRVKDYEGKNEPTVDHTDDEDDEDDEHGYSNNTGGSASEPLYLDSDSDSEEQTDGTDAPRSIDQRYTSDVAKLLEIHTESEEQLEKNKTFADFVYFISGFSYRRPGLTLEQDRAFFLDDWNDTEKETIKIDIHWYWFYTTILLDYDTKTFTRKNQDLTKIHEQIIRDIKNMGEIHSKLKSKINLRF